jgi:UDP:flavonoid glycosyltransferase YjiC (YdhE family)
VLASPLPGFTPTRAFASPLVPFRSLGPLNRLTHGVMAGSGEALFRRMIGEWRRGELGLPRRPVRALRPRATLYAYSPHAVPVPSDWPDNVAVTGYWFLDGDAGWVPDAALQAFLQSGEPPVYVGFGSMPGLDPQMLSKTVVAALQRAGRRGLLATGGGAIGGDLDAGHVHFIEGAPHDRLFPLMSACVHHGGAGTTGASLRAGKPTVVCPFFGDQPFWARRVAELGVGPAPVGKRQLSVEWLCAAIERVTTDWSIKGRAERLGEAIRAEDGVGNAIGFLGRLGLLAHGATPLRVRSSLAGASLR